MKTGRKILAGIVFGIIAGAIDTMLAAIQKSGLEAATTAFAYWLVTGIIISVTDIKVKGGLKGLVISLILLIPIAIPIVWRNASAFFPMVAFTAIVGYILGYLIEKAS